MARLRPPARGFAANICLRPGVLGWLRAWVARRRPPVWVALNTSLGTIREPSWLLHRPAFEADSRGPGAARRGSPRPGPLDSLHFSFYQTPMSLRERSRPGAGHYRAVST